MSNLVHGPLLLSIEFPVLACICELMAVCHFNCTLTDSVLFKEVTNLVSRVEEVVIPDVVVIASCELSLCARGGVNHRGAEMQ